MLSHLQSQSCHTRLEFVHQATNSRHITTLIQCREEHGMSVVCRRCRHPAAKHEVCHREMQKQEEDCRQVQTWDPAQLQYGQKVHGVVVLNLKVLTLQILHCPTFSIHLKLLPAALTQTSITQYFVLSNKLKWKCSLFSGLLLRTFSFVRVQQQHRTEQGS